MTQPLVSAVIPAYNAARTIARALASAAAQDYPAMEIVAVDDGSTDRTREVVRDFRTLPARLICLDGNRGAAAARNAGIEAARGEFVAFLDADDAWHPRKISCQMAVASRSASIGLVTCDSVVLDGAGREMKRLHGQNRPTEGAQAWKALLANNFIPTPTVLVRKSVLDQVGGFDTRLNIAEDLDLWIRVAAVSEVAVVREVLVDVHDQPDSLHKRYSEEEESSILSVVEANLERQRHRLTPREVRRILGQRYFKIGANYYAGGMYRESLPVFWRSARLGFRPVKSLFNLHRALWKTVVENPVGAHS